MLYNVLASEDLVGSAGFTQSRHVHREGSDWGFLNSKYAWVFPEPQTTGSKKRALGTRCTSFLPSICPSLNIHFWSYEGEDTRLAGPVTWHGSTFWCSYICQMYSKNLSRGPNFCWFVLPVLSRRQILVCLRSHLS